MTSENNATPQYGNLAPSKMDNKQLSDVFRPLAKEIGDGVRRGNRNKPSGIYSSKSTGSQGIHSRTVIKTEDGSLKMRDGNYPDLAWTWVPAPPLILRAHELAQEICKRGEGLEEFFGEEWSPDAYGVLRSLAKSMAKPGYEPAYPAKSAPIIRFDSNKHFEPDAAQPVDLDF